MKKNVKHFLLLSTITAGCISGINKFIDATAEIKNLLSKDNGYFYEWRYGNIFYTKQGNGSPVLLIHDLHPASSSLEWSSVIKKLEKNHTVYTIDLLGCGRSDKPDFTYTNFMYVQLLTDFIKKVIGQKTDVITTGSSCSFTLMSAHMDDSILNKLFFISPTPLDSLQLNPNRQNIFLKKILDMPIFGTFFYNIQMSGDRITDLFEKEYFLMTASISAKLKEAYYESSHRNHSRGRYLLGSIIANYTNINIIPALKKIENPIFIIGSCDIEDSLQTIDSYVKYNETIETAFISNCRRLPQLETPNKFYEIICMFED